MRISVAIRLSAILTIIATQFAFRYYSKYLQSYTHLCYVIEESANYGIIKLNINILLIKKICVKICFLTCYINICTFSCPKIFKILSNPLYRKNSSTCVVNFKIKHEKFHCHDTKLSIYALSIIVDYN